jgi:5-methylcytosine-specific restriction endonuclease McrA
LQPNIQSNVCRQPLPPRALKLRGRYAPIILRVLSYDPEPAYARIAETIDPFKRIQTRTNLSLALLFPKRADGFCDCGCGIALKGRQRRWASPECAEFAWWVYAVIAGRRDETRRCLRAYWGNACLLCGDVPMKQKKRRKRMSSAIEWDHVIPVHQGGGACWLGNWRPLCNGCHKEKTRSDRQALRTTLKTVG